MLNSNIDDMCKAPANFNELVFIQQYWKWAIPDMISNMMELYCMVHTMKQDAKFLHHCVIIWHIIKRDLTKL